MKRTDTNRIPAFGGVIQKQAEFIRHVNVAILTLFWRIGEVVNFDMPALYQTAIAGLTSQKRSSERSEPPVDLLALKELKLYSLYHYLFADPTHLPTVGGALNWVQLREKLGSDINASFGQDFALKEKDLDYFGSLQNNISNLYPQEFFASFDKLLRVNFTKGEQTGTFNKEAKASMLVLISDFKKNTCNQLNIQLNMTFWELGRSFSTSLSNKDLPKTSVVILNQFNPLIFSETYLKTMINFAKQYPRVDQAASIASSYYWHQIEAILSRNNHLQGGSPDQIGEQDTSEHNSEEAWPLNSPKILSRTEIEKERQITFQTEIIEVVDNPETLGEVEIFNTKAFRDIYLGTTSGLQVVPPKIS